MELKWHEIEPGTYEARVGDWLLEVSRSDDAQEWRAWVGLLPEKRGAQTVSGTVYRRDVTGALDEAQRAAVALAIEKCAPFVATARAEAALAEREACVFDVEPALREALGGMFRTVYAFAVVDALRARTTPATLSNDTLAAIAEARGLRVVEPEHLAELEALRAAVDEETAIDRERAEHGCGDASCVVKHATGMTTNGGCRCGRRALRAALQRARKELAERGGKDGAK